MASLDPRHWNLVPPAVLLALSACGPGPLAGDDAVGDGDTGGDGDGDDPTTTTTTTGDGDGDTSDPGCSDDDDCPSGYYCAPGGYCEYTWCGATAPGAPGTVSRGPVDPACSPPIECYVDEDCGDGFVCNWNYCEPAGPCDPFTAAEIPLPAVPGAALDLAFADLDGDGRDELVILTAGELLASDGAELTALGSVDPALDQVTPIHADADASLDLALTASDAPVSAVALGDGLGGVTVVAGGLQAAITRPVAGDWIPGGGQELIGTVDGGGSLAVRADLIGDPSEATFEPNHADLVDALGYGVWATGGEGIVTSEACAIMFYVAEGTPPPGSLPPFDAACELAVGRLDGSAYDDVATLQPGEPESLLRLVIDNAAEHLEAVPGTYVGVTPLRTDVSGSAALLLTGADASAVVRLDDDGAPACHSPVAALPVATRVVAGDLDDDGRDEIAVIDADGQVRLFRAD